MSTNPNMEAIETITATTSVANITFSNIPQGYTDLCIMLSFRAANSGSAGYDFYADMSFNGSTSTATFRRLAGYSTTVASDNGTRLYAASFLGSTGTASTFGNAQVYIPNYTGSNYKSYSSESAAETNSSNNYLDMTSGLWSNTAAITSITFTPSAGNFAQHSSATLYGVTSVATAAKATGGIITMDDNYFYHTFLASGTFTPTSSYSADVLVIAGGGSGGYSYGGGGGGGGLCYQTGRSLTSSS